MTTTERTAIRRRLAIRRTAHRPPWGGRRAGHGSIVAPLAATIAATLAATVAVGVGVALARAERDRRSARARRSRDHQFAPLPGERPADGLRRMALGQLDLAIELLAGEGDVPAEKAVHETRKALKRLRALVRLLREELGEKAFAREDAVLRNAGQRLASARDAEVMVSTLDGLLKRHPRKLGARRSVRKLRRALVAERDRAIKRALGDVAERAQVLSELRAARGRVAAWSLSDRGGIKLVEADLRRLYRQGRRRGRRAGRSPIGQGKGDGARALHQWRKRVKDLRYAAELLGLRQIAGRAERLGEVLGEEHDLALLAARVSAPGGPLAGRKKARKALLKQIARRRKSLRKRALREGKRFYRRKPKRFTARVRREIVS